MNSDKGILYVCKKEIRKVFTDMEQLLRCIIKWEQQEAE